MEAGKALAGLLSMQGNTWGMTGPCQGWVRGKACGRKTQSPYIHMGGFGSFLWKCYQRWQTLPLDAANQALKPPSHVQHGCQPEAPMGQFVKYRVGREAKVALGFLICALALVYRAATSKNMEKASFGATFCSIPHWWMILKRFCTFVPKNWEVSGNTPAVHKQCPDAQYSEQHLPGWRSLRPLWCHS